MVQFGPLDEADSSLRDRLVDAMNMQNKVRLPRLSSISMSRLKTVTTTVSNILPFIATDDITALNSLLYAVAYVVTELVGVTIRHTTTVTNDKQKNERWWRKRLESKIAKLRKDLGRLLEWKAGKLTNPSSQKSLSWKYRVVELGLIVVIEQVRQKLKATAAKIRRYDLRCKQYRHNTMFRTNERQFYRELNGDSKTSSETPSPVEVVEFWENIWGRAHEFNSDAEWLGKVEEGLSDIQQQPNVNITAKDVKKYLARMPFWKAPGPDHVQWFWLKKCTCLYARIAGYMRQCLNEINLPTWMTLGRTVLLQKDPAKGTVASNYRPITCLPVMWKLFTGILSEYTYRHLESEDLLVNEQKGCRKKSRGTKDQLIIDKAVLRECRARKKDLAMAWVDYRKVYDMVPHSWIVRCLQLVGVAENTRKCLQKSMTQWRVELWFGPTSLGQVEIKRGIFQGDSLSPLIFVMCLVPITLVLRSMQPGFEFASPKIKINHLLFMDDLKLFGKQEKHVQSLLHTVRICSEDIGMEFGVQKCAEIVMKRGKVVKSDGIGLPDGQNIRALEEQEVYRYLGFEEGVSINNKSNQDTVRKEYLRRVRRILRSGLSGRNCFQAINTWAVSLVRYSGGILDWTKETLRELDRKTRKLLTMHAHYILGLM